MPTHGGETLHLRCLWQRLHPRRSDGEARGHPQEEGRPRGRGADVTRGLRHGGPRVLAGRPHGSSPHVTCHLPLHLHLLLILSWISVTESLVKKHTWYSRIRHPMHVALCPNLLLHVYQHIFGSDLALMPYAELPEQYETMNINYDF